MYGLPIAALEEVTAACGVVASRASQTRRAQAGGAIDDSIVDTRLSQDLRDENDGPQKAQEPHHGDGQW